MVSICVQSFITNDLRLAFSIDPFEEMLDDICDKMQANHVERLKKGDCSIEMGIVFNDFITNFERVGDHCSNVAISMIELEHDSLATHHFEDTLTDEQKKSRDELLDSYKSKYNI